MFNTLQSPLHTLHGGLNLRDNGMNKSESLQSKTAEYSQPSEVLVHITAPSSDHRTADDGTGLALPT